MIHEKNNIDTQVVLPSMGLMFVWWKQKMQRQLWGVTAKN